MRVAILDDESVELDRVEQTLQQIPAQGEQAWTVHRLAHGEDLLKWLRREIFDLLILDWQLPDLSSLQLLRWSREHPDTPPSAIVLTSRDAGQDIVQALNSNADGYASKPFRPNELKARVATVLCHHGGTRPTWHGVRTFGDLNLNDTGLIMTRVGVSISLIEREYRLARCLFANLGRPLSRGYLYERFWPREEVLSSWPLDTHIYHLRNELGLTAECGWRLLAIYGCGYRLKSVVTVD